MSAHALSMAWLSLAGGLMVAGYARCWWLYFNDRYFDTDGWIILHGSFAIPVAIILTLVAWANL